MIIYLYLCGTITLLMKVTFLSRGLEELFIRGKTKDIKLKQYNRDAKFIAAYQRVISIMIAVTGVGELRDYSILHYERLRFRPESSVRIMNNRVERLLFIESETGIEIRIIEIDRNHYGDKR